MRDYLTLGLHVQCSEMLQHLVTPASTNFGFESLDQFNFRDLYQ